jgi:hypothetical protein
MGFPLSFGNVLELARRTLPETGKYAVKAAVLF